ncbi:WcaI family glycosyltransferase [Chloroflexota bacterium]
MKILVMGMNYAPERTGIGLFTTELCEYVASQGHCVSVTTAFPHYPEWKIHEHHRGRLFQREEMNGVSVYRSYVYIPGKPSARQRILYDASLSISAFLSALTVRNVDLVLAIAPPVQLGLVAWILCKVKRATFVLQLQDLAVDAAVALGMLNNRGLIHLARNLEDLLYRKAQVISVICQGFADNLKTRCVPEPKIQVLSNWVDTEFISPLGRDNSFRRANKLDQQQFVILHAGNMGAKQGLGNALQAAKLLETQDHILFLLVGEGSEKADHVNVVSTEAISNVRLLPLQPREMLPQMLSAADVLLLNQRADVVDMVIPSKLLTYMAAGRPIVAAVHADSEAARYIERAQCGLVVPPEEPDLLANAIRHLREDSELRVCLGAHGRQFAVANLSRQRVLDRYIELFESLARNQNPQKARVRTGTPEMEQKTTITSVREMPITSDAKVTQRRTYRYVKRFIDLCVSTMALILLLPFLFLIGFLIKLTSPGSVFYRWPVVGLRGRPLTGFKFRTMVQDADKLKVQLLADNEMQGPVFKMKDDPRITSIGRFLRKFSIDELPQLWSVLKGDMSLVGPRPPLQTEWVEFESWQRRKLSVKPGMTCLWQISGRNEIEDFDEWVRLDLEYIDNWSLWLDFEILLRTIPAAMAGTGR